MRLKDKVVLITGGYTGIGKAIAERCVSEGAKVVVNGLEEERGLALVAKLGEENAAHITVDITEDQARKKLVEKCVSQFGK